MEKICVAVRLRPPVPQESSNGTFWKVEDNRVSLQKPLGTPIHGYSYAFDHVFDESCSNARVYELLAKDIIHAAVDGFNGTAFAYGQTSSGKTFTMNGCGSDPGIICLAIKDIFGKIQMTLDREFLIRVSYMEIYNEEIIDLLAIENQKLQIKESLESGIFVAGLKEEIVNNAEQVLKLIDLGEVNRHFGETNMNVRSSRSHTIFRMVIESKGKDLVSDAVRVSVLNLVDLAGSERIAKTGAGGVRLKEGKHINKSLLILGNVINKLSDGAKQRAHIPYRDSKLTRILQPALGGNAKTSIICTIAPEEVHVEETKGTLQFASRAKRITNCAQVNEILTDAALLKRQKLEIEELRQKLQGSHSEVLEKEILKLRNEMLKYEVEREKLELELEEERKSQKEREQCIKEQQEKIENLNNLVTSSDCDKKLIKCSVKESLKTESSNSQSKCDVDVFTTPCFKGNAFVAKRANYSSVPDCSPLPDSLSNVADEDTWLKMNKGYIADLDSLRMTPATKVRPSPATDTTTGSSSDSYMEEILNLRKQLEHAIEEKNEFEINYKEQILLNKQLKGNISDLQNMILEIPETFRESVTNCKDIYKDVFSMVEDVVIKDDPSTAKLLSSTSEITSSLFSSLETHFLTAMEGGKASTGNNDIFKDQRKLLCARLTETITSLGLSQECTEGGGQAVLSRKTLEDELKMIQEKYVELEKENDNCNQYLKDARQRYRCLEDEYRTLKEERNSLLDSLSELSEKLTMVTGEKETVIKDFKMEMQKRRNLGEEIESLLQSLSQSSEELTRVIYEKGKVLKDLNTEIQKRRNLEEQIKQFSAAFSCRQRSLVSFHSEFKSKMEKLSARAPVSPLKSLG